MPRVRCNYVDCVFLDHGHCGAAAIEVDPDMGCTTFARANDLDAEDQWDSEDSELEEWDDLDVDDDDELWLDDDY